MRQVLHYSILHVAITQRVKIGLILYNLLLRGHQVRIFACYQEVRRCFLDQDAPEYMEMLETGLKNRDGDFKSLLRAAELFSLKDLSHKLEDILQLLEKGQVQDVDMAWMLLEQGVSEMSLMLSQANAGHEAEADPELMATLTFFHESQETEVETVETVSNVNRGVVKTRW